MKKTLFILFSVFTLVGELKSQTVDPRASQIADSVINAVGGMKAFNDAHYLQWTFFGTRNCRIEVPARHVVILVNVNSKTGKVFRNGNEITQADSVSYFMNRGYQI